MNSIMVHHQADKTDYLLIEDFINKLTCWRSSEEFNKALDQHIDININNLRNQANIESIKAPKKGKNPKLKIKKIVQTNSSREFQRISEEPQKRCFPNKSKKYLKIAKKKKEEEERALAMNIDKCK